MTKRKFNKLEKRISEKNVILLKDDLAYKKEVELARLDLAMSNSDIVVRRQMSEMVNRRKTLIEDIKRIEAIIRITEDQITNGVEMKSSSNK